MLLDNFIAQQIQQITLVYYQKEIWQKYYSERNIIAERLVEGMFSFVSLHRLDPQFDIGVRTIVV